LALKKLAIFLVFRIWIEELGFLIHDRRVGILDLLAGCPEHPVNNSDGILGNCYEFHLGSTELDIFR
jgi:hypothetical protein